MTDNARFWSLTPWRPLPNIVHALCVRHFDATGTDDLSLQLGDEVYITEVCGQENQWCRGWLLAQPSVTSSLSATKDAALRPKAYAGIFPRKCVHAREVLSDADVSKSEDWAYGQHKGHVRTVSAPTAPGAATTNGVAQHERKHSAPNHDPSRSVRRVDTPMAPLVPRDVTLREKGAPKEHAPLPALRIGDGGRSDAEPLVEDISSSIREWQSASVHSLALGRDYQKLEELSALVERLTDARRQLAHDLLTEKEAQKLRDQVVWNLVRGNKMLESEVIVRSAAQKGRTLTAHDELSELAQTQAVMSLRDRTLPATTRQTNLSHLLMDVKGVPQKLGDPALLHIYLCSVSSSGKPRPVSEAFAVELAIEEESNVVEIADGFSKTLFAELNKADVGGGDQSDSRLYLISRLIRDEPIHVPRHASSMPNSPNPEQPDADANASRMSCRARSRSRLRSEAGDRERPGTGASKTSILKRASSVTRGRTSGTATSTHASQEALPAKKTRRVAGWAAVSVSSLIRDRAHESVTLSFWAPTVPSDPYSEDPVSGEDGWNEVLKLLMRSPSNRFSKLSDAGTLTLDLTAFAADDVHTLVRDKPALLRQVHITPALSLNGAAKQLRSDIYLTLRGPIWPARARAFHPQHGSVPINADTDLLNLQVTLEVRTNDGRRLDDAIHPTANRRPHTAFRSPAIERGEAWNQTIKLSLAPAELPDAHVIMSIADGAGFPFALAWLPLWDRVNGFPPDGQQNLALWDYCEYTANLVDGRGAYQSLPSRAEEMKIQNIPQMACLAVETHLSSTSATQNADVLALSSLERTEPHQIVELLGRFSSIPDEEIAKFFGPILVSLDYSMEQSTDWQHDDPNMQASSNELSNLATKALGHAARLTTDRRFPHLADVLKEYMKRRNPTADARLNLLRSLRSMLSTPFDARGGRDLRACLKVTDVLLMFALRRGTGSEGQQERTLTRIQREISEYFEDISVLLSNTNHLALPTQVIILQNLHSWLQEALPICSEQDVLRFASSAIDASAYQQTPLWMHRLSMIHNIFAVEALSSTTLRHGLVGMTESWLAPVWPESPDLIETDLSALRLCCTVLKDQQPYLSRSQSQRYVQQLFNAFYMIEQSELGTSAKAAKPKTSRSRRKNFSPLFPTSYPFRTVSIAKEGPPIEVLLEITAVLGMFFQPGTLLVDDDEDEDPVRGDDSAEPVNMLDDSDLAKALFVVRALQSNTAFPKSWLSMSVVLSRCTVNILSWLLQHLQSALPADGDNDEDAVLDFDGALWTHWFEALIALVTSEIVRMEEHSEQKRRAVWMIGGDIRESAAGLLKRAWDLLGWENDEMTAQMYRLEKMSGYQVQFTARLIPSIVSLGLSLHANLRNTAVEVLRSMIISEWELSGDLEVIKSAFADALDMAFRDEKFEPNQAKLLVDNTRKNTAYLEESGAEDLYLAVDAMLTEVQRLIEMLLNVHHSSGDLPSTQLEQRVKLLDYLRTTNNEDSYLRHIHDVAESQVTNRNYSSAALAMQLHLDLLRSKSEPGVDHQMAKAYAELQLPSQTVFQRRQMLYAAIVKYFRMGCCWSKVLYALEQQRQELLECFDSANLANVLREQADVYGKLSSGKDLIMPRFFKVAFTNIGFPSSVLGKSFVYEAAAEDDTSKFARRLKEIYPTASIIHSGVTSASNASDQPRIHIISVNVNRDQLDPINHRSGVSPFFRLYHLSSNPMIFSNSTRQQKPGVSVAEQTVAKTLYYTAEPLPSLLGRAEIIKEEALVLSPIQAAIDRTHRKTLDIAEALLSSSVIDTAENDKLVQSIRSSVDPLSPDSVAAYHELLLDDEGATPSITSGPNGSIASSSNHAHSITPSHLQPADQHKQYISALTTALQDHVQTIEQALASSFDYRTSIKSILRSDLEQTFELELHGLYPLGDWRVQSPAWTDHPAANARTGATHSPRATTSLFGGYTISSTGPANGIGPAAPAPDASHHTRSESAASHHAAGTSSQPTGRAHRRFFSSGGGGGTGTGTNTGANTTGYGTPSRGGSRMGYYAAVDSETETEAEGPHGPPGSSWGRAKGQGGGKRRRSSVRRRLSFLSLRKEGGGQEGRA